MPRCCATSQEAFFRRLASPAFGGSRSLRLRHVSFASPDLPHLNQSRILGPGECSATDVVELSAMHLPDKARVVFSPAATLRCSMAETFPRE